MPQSRFITSMVLASATACVHADVVYLTQERTIEAATTANAGLVTASAPDFGPFVEAVLSRTTFPTASGPADNTGESTIDCQLDPNAIRAFGSLTGAGGLNVNGQLEAGEAAALILVTFSVASPTPFQILATPRPSDDPRDEWEIELENVQTGLQLFRIDETAPRQSVDVSGVLQPGTYSIQFQVEMTVEAAQVSQTFDFQFLVPAPGGVAALGLGCLAAVRRRR
jgi:hypothetical protein